jgi:hypothetical protein
MQLRHAVGQLVEALSYELKGRGFNTDSNRNDYLGISLGTKVACA